MTEEGETLRLNINMKVAFGVLTLERERERERVSIERKNNGFLWVTGLCFSCVLFMVERKYSCC